MDKKILIAGGVLAAAIAGGAAWFAFSGGEPKTLATYWDGESALNQADKSGKLPLIKAVEAGDEDVVRYLIAEGADTDKADRSGFSALATAAAKGDFSLFEAVAAGSKADLKAPLLLDKAMDGGNLKIVQFLLNKGSDANAVLQFKGKHRPDDMPGLEDPRVITPLKKAVAAGRADIAKALLDKGAKGATYFLEENVSSAKPDMVKVLGDAAGDLRALTAKGRDLLTFAAERAPLETLAYLIDKNAGDVNLALMQVLVNRKDEANGAATDGEAAAETAKPAGKAEVVAMMLQKGARPTAEAMEMMLAQKRTDIYLSLAKCMPNPNVEAASGGSMLMYATKNGYTEAAKYMLEQGADMWLAEKGGKSPLAVAIENAQKFPEMAALFESRLKSVDESGYDGETAMMLYAAAGNDTGFQQYVSKGGDIFAQDNAGKNVFMYAAEGGNRKIIDYLLYNGGNLAAKDNAGRTALMYAAGNGQDAEVLYLLEKGAKATEADYEGKTVLMYAAEKCRGETLNELVSAGESPAKLDNNKRIALMYAAEAGNVSAAEALLAQNDDIGVFDADDRSVLMYAAKGGDVEMIRLIRSYGGDIYAADKNNMSPLMYAAKSGDKEAFDLLTDWNMAYGGVHRRSGKTVLMYAAEGNNVEIIDKVRGNAMAGVNKKDRLGRTALMYMVNEVRPDILRSFIRGGANAAARDNAGKSVLMYAAEANVAVNMVTVLQNLPELEARSVDWRDNDGKTALMYAASGKNAQLIKVHMLLGRKVDANITDNSGKTALMYAVGNADGARVDAKLVEEVLAATQQPDGKDDNGRTALMYAAENPQAGSLILDMLINRGADVNAADNTGKTVLMYAAAGGDIGKLRLLIDKGAKTGAKTQDGKTAADFAKESGSCFAGAAQAFLK